MKRPTINDVARECGVSLSTVSLVLNNNPRISEATRARVLEVMERMGYLPNVQARALASRSSRTLSVVVPHLNHVFADIYFGEIVSGIYDRCLEHGYRMMLDIANQRFVKQREYVNIMRSRRADCMLFIASSVEDEYLREFEDSPFPFLLVNHYFPNMNLNHIMVDYRQSARLAAEHLVGLGHRKIGIIAGTNTYTGRDYRDTFIAACCVRGCRWEDLPWVDGGKEWSQEGGFRAARMLLDEYPDITAIMAGNDRLAVGAMRYLHEKGLRVPQDVSVMGVDDIPQAAYTTPALTTIRHPLYELGQRAAEKAILLFREEIRSCNEVLPVELVVRESTGPAPSR